MGLRYDQLSLDERCEIYRLHADGKSRRAIARALGRAPSTICRELERNSGVQVGYKVEWAMIQARARRRRKLYKLECSSALRDLVLDGLAMGWSPEQIAGRLERENGRRLISHESIYRYVYWRVSGHWEADLMLFGRGGGAILVAHERRSRLTLLHLQSSKHAKPIADRMVSMLAAMPLETRRSVTFDNGSEFSEHRRLSDRLGMATYFCEPRSPWQKGGVENAIGRLRRWLPRKTDPTTISQQEIDQIILDINLTPRKCLGFRTPLEIFFETNVSIGIALEM